MRNLTVSNRATFEVSKLYNLDRDHMWCDAMPSTYQLRHNLQEHRPRRRSDEYTPTRVPWAEIKRISSLQPNYISFASVQYLNTHLVTLHAQTARPYTCCIKFKSEKCAFLGYYAARRCNILPKFRSTYRFNFHGSGTHEQDFKILELGDGTDRLSRNVGKKLPLLDG
jgi:hypothetical protein